VTRRRHQDAEVRRRRAWPVVLAALTVFGLLGSMPLMLNALHVHLTPVAATSSHGVPLLKAPRGPAPVALPPVARPISPGQAPASLPNVSPAKETSVVSAEDGRIRMLLHNAVRIYQPEVLPYRGSLPTVVLTAGSHVYTAADLVQYGALVMLPNHAALLLDNVFVSTNAQLSLGSPTLNALYLDSTSGGFASIVAWGGSLSFNGTSSQPLTIMGWNRATKAPAADEGNGRSYIREVGGAMTLTDVRASSLGFWSGRTGGVAWTGISGAPSRGGATGSTFTQDVYGAFVSRGKGVTFANDLFEFNDLDGLHIHRYSVGSQVASSSASRNGANGFLVDRATQNTVLRGDVSQNNVTNGYFIDGRPLVSGASASGSSVQPSTGTVLQSSAATGNGHIGILVEGGSGIVIKADQICDKTTAIVVRAGATNSVLTGNDIGCAPRSGMSVGPFAPGTVISGNTMSSPHIGMLIRSSGPVEVDNNRIIGATTFGITVRGLTSQVKGVGNVISGTGFRAIDARALAGTPDMTGTDTSGWAHHAHITFWTYLQFHPLAALWLGILVLVVLAAAWSYRRRLPPHPYPASTRWSGVAPEAQEARPLPDPGPAWPQRQPQLQRQFQPQAPVRHPSPARHAAAGRERAAERELVARELAGRELAGRELAARREPVGSPEPAGRQEPATWWDPDPRPEFAARSEAAAPARAEPAFRPDAAVRPERPAPPERPVWPQRPAPAAQPVWPEGPAPAERPVWRDNLPAVGSGPVFTGRHSSSAERFPVASSGPPWTAMPAQPDPLQLEPWGAASAQAERMQPEPWGAASAQPGSWQREPWGGVPAQPEHNWRGQAERDWPPQPDRGQPERDWPVENTRERMEITRPLPKVRER
jgi:Right handed beta helix region